MYTVNKLNLQALQFQHSIGAKHISPTIGTSSFHLHAVQGSHCQEISAKICNPVALLCTPSMGWAIC